MFTINKAILAQKRVVDITPPIVTRKSFLIIPKNIYDPSSPPSGKRKLAKRQVRQDKIEVIFIALEYLIL
jgi:hypothetical protein